MTEAFEIGVSLALQDGVSDAIAKARRDVAALEHAVRESGISLKSLREVGAKAASVSFADQRGEAAARPGRRDAQDAAHRSTTDDGAATLAALLGEPAPSPEAERPGETAPPVQMTDAPAAARGLDASARHTTRHVEPIATPPLARAPHPPLESALKATASADIVTRAEPSSPGVWGNSAPVAPVASPQRATEGEKRVFLDTASWSSPASAPKAPTALVGAGLVAPTTPAPTERDDGPADAEPVTLVTALRLSGGVAAMPQGETRVVAQPETISVALHDVRTDPGPPVQTNAGVASGAAPQAGAVSPSVPAQTAPLRAESYDDKPNEGDVFLDGMLVGRWMSKFLNREAARASAGPTGFDARRGQLLPGVTVGG
jgi:hypothetical protein